VAAESPAISDAPSLPLRSVSNRARASVVLIGFALAALVAIALAVNWRARPSTAAAPTATPTQELPADVTVVLPADVAASAEDAWLRLGVMDLLATRLREAGVKVLPSDNVVRLLPAGTRRNDAITLLRRLSARGTLIASVVRRTGALWIVRAELLDAGGANTADEAQSENVIDAARTVADRLLLRLGKPAGGALPDHRELSEAELLQRIDATRLAHQAAAARALIDAAPTPLQRTLPVRVRRAQIDLDLGNSEVARQQLDALAGETSAEADPLTLARIQRSLAIALSRLGQADAALRACDSGIALLEGHDLPDEVARTFNTRGIVHLTREEYDLASQDFARARIAANLAVDSLLLAQIDGNESNLQALQGRYAEVVATQQRIGQRFERFGMIDEYVMSLINQGSAEITLLRPLDALDTSSRMMALLARVQNAAIRLQGYLERANALELNGRLGEQRAILDRAVEEADNESLTGERALARAGLARVELAEGQPAAALTSARQALSALPAPTYNAHRSGVWLTLVRSLQALGRRDEAASEARAFAAWAATSNDDSVAVFAHLAEAEQAANERRADAARAAYEQTLGIARRWSAPDVVREVVTSYGRFLIDQGDLAKAGTIIGLVASHADVDFDAAVLQAQLYRALGQAEAADGAVAQARRLAGERVLPAALLAAPALVTQKSSSGKGSDTRLE
jgi:tetratricopeptide (TPR) repeat protein